MAGANSQTPKRATVQSGPEGLTIAYHWRNWGFILMCLAGLMFTGVALSLLTKVDDLLFLLPFLGVGLALLYWSLGKVINHTEIRIQGNQLTVRHKPLPWRGNITIPVSDIKQVTAQDYYVGDEDMAYKHYRLVAITQEGRQLRLVPDMDRFDTPDFMAQEIETYIGLRKPLDAAEKEAAQLERTAEVKREEVGQLGFAAAFSSFVMLILVVVSVYQLVIGTAEFIVTGTSQNWASAPYGNIIEGLVYLGLAGMFGGIVWGIRRGIAKTTGEGPSWEELIPWLKLITRLRS